ncbi:unnamed protein product [Mytilus coruscus]|uniref:Mitochondria-eating protein C-terminal domain-containing protein n=1 Tax=Mytilus coruscus TaxID=42192 RepID=A0A6J8EAQ8_MYTCO|nr:unnamed protein product [Mytilus coruscus]
MVYLNGIHFALRGGKEHRNLRLNKNPQITGPYIDSELHKRYILYKEDISKTNSGGIKDKKYTPKTVKAYENIEYPDRCIVTLFQKYKRLCPKDEVDAFYFKPLVKYTTDQWFCKVPVIVVMLFVVTKGQQTSNKFSHQRSCMAKSRKLPRAQRRNYNQKRKKLVKDEMVNLPVCKEASVLRRAKSEDFAKFLFQNQVLCKNTVADWDYINKNESIMQILLESSFFEKCVYLCWSMVIQDPVMYLDDGPIPLTPIDKNTYKEFVKSGDSVAYLVWPALFLHKDGPLLYKGVVQAYWKREEDDNMERTSV